MIEYTTLKGKLRLPEYGRHIQQMVEHALTIEDKEERTRCVNSIITIMGNLFPHLRDVNDFRHKLWEHVAIMSDFKLDIEFPYEIKDKTALNLRPEQIPYKNSRIRYMHYGRNLEEMIDIVSDYPEGPTKNGIICLIANQMKKCFLNWNKEVVDDKKIFQDLKEMSDGKIDVSADIFRLMDSKDALNPRKTPARQKKR